MEQEIVKPHYKTYANVLKQWQKKWDKTYNVGVSINLAEYVSSKKQEI